MSSKIEQENTTKKKTWERRIDDARKRHRPSLKNWARDGFATSRYSEFLQLRDPIKFNQTEYRVKPIAKVDAYDLSVQTFLDSYEKLCIPLIISNVPQKENWPAVTEENWKFENLKAKYKEDYLKCGEDDDGYKITIRLKYFLDYMKHNKDDSPLYIFDSAYGDPNKKNPNNVKKTTDILYDYKVPSYFPYDLFELVGEKRRPPYRWFLVGPERSGTTIHIDPLGTSAWNTLISGRKRWILFPPGLAKRFVKGIEMIQKGEDDEAVNYFMDIYPRMKEKYLKVSNTMNIPLEYRGLFAYECIQEPGDTIFVPSGWWHTVLNLTDTVAITQNYCSYNNFDGVWKQTRTGRKKMSVKWLEKLKDAHPILHKRALELNAIDDFVMPYALKKQQQQEKEEEERKRKEQLQKEKEKENIQKVSNEQQQEESQENSMKKPHKEKKSKKSSSTAEGKEETDNSHEKTSQKKNKKRKHEGKEEDSDETVDSEEVQKKKKKKKSSSCGCA